MRSGASLKRDQVFRRDFTEKRRNEIAAELEQLGDDAERRGIELARTLHGDRTLLSQHDALLYALATLQRGTETLTLDTESVTELARIVTSVLRRHAVHPSRSRLSYLHDELRAAIAAWEAHEGRAFRAMWERGLANRSLDRLSASTDLSLRHSLSREAVARLVAAEIAPLDVAEAARVRLARVRVLRLTGKRAEASALLETIVHPDLHGDVTWEAARMSGELEAQARLLRVERALRTPERLLAFRLHAHAVQSKRFMNEAPRAASLKSEAIDPATLRFAIALDRCHRSTSSLSLRLRTLGQALDRAEEVRSTEERLLVFAAATRFLVRVRRPELAAVPLAAYHATCLGLTEGLTNDVLEVMADLGDKVPPSVVPLSAFAAHMKEPKATFGARPMVLAKMAVGLARARMRPNSEEAWTEYADVLARYMDQLKGPVMKLGQTLAAWGVDLPDEARATLSTLHDSSSAVAWPTIERILAEELGADFRERLVEIEEEPFATGSIGQVHLARLADGRAVVVKVQYPDMPAIVRADLRATSVFRPIAASLFPAWDTTALLAELEERILEECDYEHEARCQEYFRALLAPRAEMVVPEVIASCSTKRVLTSERLHGAKFADIRETASAAERRKMGETIVTFVVLTTVNDRAFNTDIHPGNMLFMPDGRIGFVDFGSSRFWREGQGGAWGTILRAMIRKEPAMLADAFYDEGMVTPEQQFDFDWAFEMLATGLLQGVFEDRVMAIPKSAVPDDIVRWLGGHPEAAKMAIPPSALFGFRAYWGMFAMLAQLGAEANWHRHLAALLGETP